MISSTGVLFSQTSYFFLFEKITYLRVEKEDFIQKMQKIFFIHYILVVYVSF